MLIRFCKNKKVERVIAIMLIITLTFANLLLLGKNLISYATENNLEKQGMETQHNNVKFDAYFDDNGGNRIHSVVFDATRNEQKMNLYIAVNRSGYLKEAYIDFRDKNNGELSYELMDDKEYTTLIQNIDTTSKTISLNYIQSGTEAVLEMPISHNLTEMISLNKLNQNSIVTLRGIYVDEQGKETQIQKSIELNIGWDIQTELEVEQAVTKYVPYNYTDQTGLLLQLAVKVKQNNDNKVLPVKETQIKMQVPEIMEMLPQKITVSASDTMATNGNKREFTSENFEYNEEEKTITITTLGYEEAGSALAGIGADEYFVSYTYPSEVYEYVQENEVVLTSNAEAKMLVYSVNGIDEKTATSSEELVLNEKIGDVVSYVINAKEDAISKGKMYANYNTNQKVYDTEYNTVIRANIQNNEIVEKLTMELKGDYFTIAEHDYTTKLSGVNYTNYKQIVINKNKMQRILGEEGFINIYDENNNVYTINNEIEDDNENYIINFEDRVGELKIETSKPVEEGILEIDTTKIIAKDLAYTKAQVAQTNSLKTVVNGKTEYIESNLSEQRAEDSIELVETSTNAQLEISDVQLSTMVENKNVEMKIVLNNNEETSDLYKNPVFQIAMPRYIDDVEITGQNVLYSNGLEIANVNKAYTNAGIVLTIDVQGAESEFSEGTFSNGANIVLNTNIKVNELTPNVSDKIKMTYSNDNVTRYEAEENGYGVNYVDLAFVAPEEMRIHNSLSVNGVEALSTGGNEKVVKLEILDSAKIATMKLSLLNKYSNACSNIRILGRIPFAGNRSIKTGLDLGSTIDTELMSAINTNGIEAQVYYSSNENATEDILDEENAWTTNYKDAKSYLIVLSDYEMKPGEMLEFSYTCQIPGNLEHNQNAYGIYAVYFDNVAEYTSNNIIEATKVGAITGAGASLEATTVAMSQGRVMSENEAVKENQYITYRTTVKNLGTVDATNVSVTSKIDNATVEKATNAETSENTLKANIETIEAGEEKTVEYTVKAREALNDEKVSNEVSVTAENFGGTLDSKIENRTEKAEIEVEMHSSLMGDEFTPGISVRHRVNVTNLTDRVLNNVVITDTLPIGLEYDLKESGEDSKVSYNEQTRTLTIRIDKIEPGDSDGKTLYLKTTLPAGTGSVVAENKFVATADGIGSYESNSRTFYISGPVLNIELSSNISNGSYIKAGREIEFTITATNTGKNSASSRAFKIELPKGIAGEEAEIQKGKEKIKPDGGVSGYYTIVTLEPNETITMKVKAIAKSIETDSEEAKVSVVANIGSVQSNILNYIIEKTNIDNPGNSGTSSKPSNPDNPSNPGEKTFKITGTAWIDENEDGIKGKNEKTLQNLEVLLVDASTGNIVTDKTNGTQKRTKTSSSGDYTFSNLTKGKYIVIFEYNSAYYDITEYKKSGATEDVTSKAIQSKINKDDELKVAGITDTITITDSSKANINIGLIVKPKFDLRLETSIAKVIVQNSTGIKTYDFNNTKLAKIEIPGKNLKGSKVFVEYRIKVKNEGEVKGYAKKIVDYMPKDFEFDPISNPTWYKGTDGNLYSDSIADFLLKPGEEMELVLMLEKTMTNENTGTRSNIAEIYEAYNEQNLQDIDSTPGNNAQNEDDLDKADVIISVKTGQVAMYISLTLICIAIIGTGVYLINKKVLKGRE